MSKGNSIFISLLLIAAGIVIHFLSERTDGTMDLELTGFFSGFLVGIGSVFLVYSIFKKDRGSDHQ